MEEQIVGGIDQLSGRIQDTVGAATGDAGLQAAGKLRQIKGRVQQSYGNALDTLRIQAEESPLRTVAAAVGVGFLIGALWARRD